jgi:hypothetical protein
MFNNPDSIICQPLDLMPSILHYVNYGETFISYGSSIFSDEDKTLIVTKNGLDYNVLKDSILLTLSKDRISSMRILNQSKFSDFDFKDSLVVEKTRIENIFQSLLNDYHQRLYDNEL